MDYEFSFQVRDSLKEHFTIEDLDKLNLKGDFPSVVHSKDQIIDIITFCSLGDFDEAKLNVEETLSFLAVARRAFIVQRLIYQYWKRCFIKTKLAVDKKPGEIESCRGYHRAIKVYREYLSNFTGFDWAWYQHFVLEIYNLKMESANINNEFLQ
jgi:hypothetical protein